MSIFVHNEDGRLEEVTDYSDVGSLQEDVAPAKPKAAPKAKDSDEAKAPAAPAASTDNK